MSTESNAVPSSDADAQVIAPGTMRPTRPLYWSVRRELWENRSIYFAPLAAAAVYTFGFFISLCILPHSMRITVAHHMDKRAELIMPYGHAAMLLILIAFIVGVLYCLDALHSERRDRSILFWKSLPVSDVTTVLSKFSIPLVILPLIVLALVVVTEWIMFIASVAVLLVTGAGAAALWAQIPLFQLAVSLFYGLIVIALWHAPLYAWLLLVSCWARRTPLLWALLPPLALGVVEKMVFNTTHVMSSVGYLLIGWFWRAFEATGGAAVDPHYVSLNQLAPGRFLTTPSLWFGLGVTAIFIIAAARLRRYRAPI
jgi:ABC-2 type transport system permease protein